MTSVDMGVPMFMGSSEDEIQYGAEDARNSLLGAYSEGVFDDTGEVSESDPTALTVDVAAVKAIVAGAAVGQGNYYVRSTDAVTLAAADRSNPRIDRIVARVYDSPYDGSGQKKWQVEAVTGTPTAGADASANENGIAALPDSAVELARATVAANATDLLDADIVDVRKRAGYVSAVLTDVLPASPHDGMVIDFATEARLSRGA